MNTNQLPIRDKQPSWHQRLVRLSRFFARLTASALTAALIVGAGLLFGLGLLSLPDKAQSAIVMVVACMVVAGFAITVCAVVWEAIRNAWDRSA